MNHIGSLLAAIALAGVAGCGVEAADGPLGIAEEEAIAPNAIAPNAIAPNAIAPNAIAPNAIAPNALPAAALLALQNPDNAGVLSRMFVKYAVGCALTPGESFAFSWTDTTGTVHAETYWGLLGLAPSWASGPLDAEGQRFVSACMAARTNYYGVPVEISVRADIDVLEQNTSAAELGAYSHIEGAFWGNLFAPAPYLRACYRAENVAHSRSMMRDCAAGHVNADGTIAQCGLLHSVGSCTTVCKKILKAGGYYTHCDAEAGGDDDDAGDFFITVGLQ